jgi:ABC-type oligopeptide transport system ATPase subunit
MTNELETREGMTAPLINVDALSMVYAQPRTFRRDLHRVTAVENARLQIFAGETLGIVGISGSGKSTLARCMAGLETPTSGSVSFAGRNVQKLLGDERRWFHRNVQLVLQDSASALNPRFTAAEIIDEPMRICGVGTKAEQYACVLELLRQLELPVTVAGRRPHQLSGGQRQRLAIARALALKPTVLILDEVLAGLDIPVQKHILDLLKSLSRQHSLTYVFISHDLRLMGTITDRIAVMHSGRIVEQGSTRDIFTNPQHPHTRDLLSANIGRVAFPCAAQGGE